MKPFDQDLSPQIVHNNCQFCHGCGVQYPEGTMKEVSGRFFCKACVKKGRDRAYRARMDRKDR